MPKDKVTPTRGGYPAGDKAVKEITSPPQAMSKAATSFTFIKFTEENDGEGETWHFYLQYEGNEAALERLHFLLKQIAKEVESDLPYSLSDNEQLPESTVNILVEHANNKGSYALAHTKLTGRMTIPEKLINDPHEKALEHALYKGSIADWFTS